MVHAFLERLPYIILAAVVFLLFYLGAKLLRRTVNRLADRRMRRKNVSLVMGRVVQGATVFLGLMIAMVIALPSFKPAHGVAAPSGSSAARAP